MNVADEALPPQFVGSPVGDTAEVQVLVATAVEPEAVELPGYACAVGPVNRTAAATVRTQPLTLTAPPL